MTLDEFFRAALGESIAEGYSHSYHGEPIDHDRPVKVADGVIVTAREAFQLGTDAWVYGNAYAAPAGDCAPEGVTHRRVDPRRVTRSGDGRAGADPRPAVPRR